MHQVRIPSLPHWATILHSCNSHIAKIYLLFFSLDFVGVSLSELSTTLIYSVVNSYMIPYCHKYIYRFATLADIKEINFV